jgi:hypothetical protein
MRLSETKIAELQKLYRVHFGKEITSEEAQTLGVALVRIVLVMNAKDMDMQAMKTVNARSHTEGDRHGEHCNP